MAEVRGFLGVPDPVLRALGCLTVAAGRLESTIRTMLADLQVNPGSMQTAQALREIRRAVGSGLPAHARVAPQEVIDWTHEAGAGLEERNVPVHSAAASRRDDGAWRPVGIHLRSGDEWALDDDQLMAAATRLAGLAHAGNELDMALRHTPRKGVFLPNTVVDGAWVPTCSTDVGGADLERPTEQELDEWWRTMGPFPEI